MSLIIDPLHHRYGWRPSKPDHRDRLFIPPSVSLPSAVDLRPHCAPVEDQGAAGSCTSFALAALLEFDMLKQGKSLTVPAHLFIYYNERLLEGDTDYDAGAELRDGLKALARWGYPPETDWPYNLDMLTIRPPVKIYHEAQATRIARYASITQSIIPICTALANGLPVAFGFTVFESLETPAVTATGMVPLPGPDESVLGGHAVCLVGYDSVKQLFTFRNSWSTSWGDMGYGYLPYNYVNNPQLASDFWVIDAVK